MQLDKSQYKEEAHIGEELMEDSKVSPLDRRCFAVKQMVEDKVFTLDEALAAYSVNKDDFNNYLSRYVVSEINVLLLDSSSVIAVTASLAVISKLYQTFVGSIDPEAQAFQNHLLSLSQAVSSGKVAV
ncbi:MAG TPA: hypothetical protein VG605_16335 [Puia sp.]|nr:hypothetical protein [Puia sp.]